MPYDEEGGIKDERRREYNRLMLLTNEAWGTMADAGCTLVHTKPATLAGILSLCRYIEPLFAEDDQPNLPEHIKYDDDTQEASAEAL